MDGRIINKMYFIIDTLHTDADQSVHLCKRVDATDEEPLILNEFTDGNVIYNIKDSFSIGNSEILPNFVEAFYVDFNFYVVCKMCKGISIEEFLSNNNLQVVEKMYLIEDLISKFSGMERMNPVIAYSLAEELNIFILKGKTICLNHFFLIDKDNLNVAHRDIPKRLGQIILDIFVNVAGANLETQKYNLPPAITKIVERCWNGEYLNAAQINADFKSTLLYSVFRSEQSVDAQIRKRLKKAKRKHMMKLPKAIMAILIFIALVSSVWAYSTTDFLHFKKPIPVATVKSNINTKPVAKFTPSITNVNVGDKVTFNNESFDYDKNDTVSTSSWAIAKDGLTVVTATEKSLTYKFDLAGDYLISLVVRDSKGASSDLTEYRLDVKAKEIVNGNIDLK